MNRMTFFIKDKVRNTVWRFYAFTFFKNLMFFSAVLIPFYTDWGHIDLAHVQILQSWFMFWIFVSEVPTGVVADFFGRKYSLALGAFLTVFAVLIYGSIPKFEIFLLGEFLFAIGVALTSGADDALLYDSLKEVGHEGEAKTIMGRARSIELAGIFVSAPIGSLIAARFGLNAPMLFSSLSAIAAGILALSLREPSIVGETSERRRYWEIFKNGTRFFYRHPNLRPIAIDAIAVASASYFVIWLYQPVLKNLAVPIVYFGIVQALLVGVEILITSNFVRLEKLFGSGGNYLRFSAGITAAAFVIVAFFPNVITVLLFIVLAGGFGLTRLDLMGIYMNNFIESHQRATVLSAISMFRRLSLVILNPIIGFMADRSLGMALLAVSILPLLVFLFSPIEQKLLEEKKTT